MASVGHIAFGVAAARFADRLEGPKPRLGLSIALFGTLALLPDVDVLGLALGVPYGAPWGHRGATHSIAMALAAAALAALIARGLGARPLVWGLVALFAIGSHGPLDALTDGGRGVALLWPFSDRRWFAPIQPIPVAPLGLDFISVGGLVVVVVETTLFSPFLLYGLFPRSLLRTSF